MCLWLDRDTQIATAKKALVARTHAAADIFLVWNGRILEDDDVLKEGATVMVSHRQRGGCFIFSFTILCLIFTALVGSMCTCGLSLFIIPVLLPLLFILPCFCL